MEPATSPPSQICTSTSAGSKQATIRSGSGAGARARDVIRQRFSVLVAVAVDVTVMVVAVEGMGASPALATAAGGSTGALLAFALGRRWTQDVTDDALAHQAARYALVAATAVGFNAMGEGVAVALGVHYLLARLVIASVVGALWSLPMQQHYVFRGALGYRYPRAGSTVRPLM